LQWPDCYLGVSYVIPKQIFGCGCVFAVLQWEIKSIRGRRGDRNVWLGTVEFRKDIVIELVLGKAFVLCNVLETL